MTAVAAEPTPGVRARTFQIVVDDGFHPSVIRAPAGHPLRLLFTRLDGSECAARVVFSSPRIERHLALAATTVVDLPAQTPGNARFTCGMGRYSGRIQIFEPAPSVVARLVRRAAAAFSTRLARSPSRRTLSGPTQDRG